MYTKMIKMHDEKNQRNFKKCDFINKLNIAILQYKHYSTSRALSFFWITARLLCVFSTLWLVFCGLIHHYLQSSTSFNPLHCLSFGSEDFLNVSEAKDQH